MMGEEEGADSQPVKQEVTHALIASKRDET